MSSFHSDDFDNNWNDNSSSFQDLLIENADQMEFSTIDTRCKKKQKKCFNDIGFQIHHDRLTLKSICDNENTDFTQQLLSDNTNLIHYNDQYNIRAENTNVKPTTNCQKVYSNRLITEHDDDIWLEFEEINIPEELIKENKACSNTKEIDAKEQVKNRPTSLDWADNALQQFGGFKTAGTKKEIKPSDSALKFANENAFCLIPSQSSQPLLSLAPISQNRNQQSTYFPSKKYDSGFTTGRGAHLNEPSKEAKEKANNLFYSNSVGLTQYQLGFDKKEHINGKQTKQKYKYIENDLPSLEHTAFQYDNLIEKYGGFFRANRKEKIDVSKKAKAQALKSFHVNKTESYNNNDITTKNTSIYRHYERKASKIDNTFVPKLKNQESPNIVTQNSNTHDSLLLLKSNINNNLSKQQCKNNPEDNAEVAISSKILDSSSKLTTMGLQRKNHTTSRRQYKIKPFKSPAVDLSLIKLGLEKPRKSNSNNNDTNSNENCHNGAKRISVFNINPIGCRRPLYSLGSLKKHSNTELVSMGIPEEIVFSTPMSSRSLYIKPNWNSVNAKEEIIKRGALSHLIPKGWIEHHYGWIVWKLTKRICMFPQYIDDWWNSEYIIHQLLYRYEREINLGHRSILKKIMERDDVSTKHMVLMVADIIPTIDSNKILSNFKEKNIYQLLLTDGWYAISVSIDNRMAEAIRKGKLHIGHKLSITGAQLIGDKSPSRPLELTFLDYENMTIKTSVGLLISSNSSCKCPWYTKLGCQPNYRRNKTKRNLESIHEDGGLVSILDVIICRKYPMLYIETLNNGMVRVLNSREEESIRWKRQSSEQRQVSSYFRLRLCDIPDQNRITNPTVTVTLLVSQASEIMYMDLMEGQYYRLYFLQPYKPKNNKHYGKLHLKTSFQTKWERLPQFQPLNTFTFPFRTITSCASIMDNSNSNKKLMDMDVVVYILYLQPLQNRKQPDGSVIWLQTMLVTDSTKQLCQITLQSLLKPTHNFQDQVLGFINVWYDTYDAKFNIIHIKTSYETEICTKPTGGTMLYVQNAIEELKQWKKSSQNELTELRQQVDKLVKH